MLVVKKVQEKEDFFLERSKFKSDSTIVSLFASFTGVGHKILLVIFVDIQEFLLASRTIKDYAKLLFDSFCNILSDGVIDVVIIYFCF